MPLLWSDVIVAALVALLFSGILGTFLRFASPARGRAALGALVVLFAILFFSVWAGGVWLPRAGPAAFGVRWLSFFVVGLLLTAIIVALVPPGRSQLPAGGVAARERAGTFSVTSFFWIAVVLLLLMIVAAYAGG